MEHGVDFVIVQGAVHEVVILKIPAHDRDFFESVGFEQAAGWHKIALEHDHIRAKLGQELDNGGAEQAEGAGHEHALPAPKGEAVGG